MIKFIISLLLFSAYLILAYACTPSQGSLTVIDITASSSSSSSTAGTPETPGWIAPKKGISGPDSTNMTTPGVTYLYYNWGPTPAVVGHLPPGSIFVPMIWSSYFADESYLNQVTNYSNLLGFNEPDNAGQANMSPAQALALWPELEATGCRLGSPAESSFNGYSYNGWLYQFMQGAALSNFRVDFICLHYYGEDSGDNNNPTNAVRTMMTMISNVYNDYHKPIWLTEFALSYANGATEAQQQLFMQMALHMLESTSFVEHYFWFISGCYTNSTCALEDPDSNINSLGVYYRDFLSEELTDEVSKWNH